MEIDKFIKVYDNVFEFKHVASLIKYAANKIEFEDAKILGDNDDQIIEIFENLISNALTYSQESTTININFEVGSSEICFIVEDQGCGIPKQDILKVTERFYRSKNATQFKKSSSGLGLSIVKHIVNRHAGRLVIESEENTGSIFKVFLPVYIEK